MIILTVNGTEYQLDVPPDTPLLWVLRDTLGLTGTKYGCGLGVCGACTVHLDGLAIRSCGMKVSAVEQKQVTTIEGISASRVGQAVQRAWIELGVPQCGYCQPGQIMAATALLNAKPKPTDGDIEESMTNLCRCGTYTRIRAAIHHTAAQRGGVR